jgi:hypothetical protein
VKVFVSEVEVAVNARPVTNPAITVSPFTESLVPGVVVPMPTSPDPLMRIRSARLPAERRVWKRRAEVIPLTSVRSPSIYAASFTPPAAFSTWKTRREAISFVAVPLVMRRNVTLVRAPVTEAASRSNIAVPAGVYTWNGTEGLEVPIPTYPVVPSMVKKGMLEVASVLADVEAIKKFPAIERSAQPFVPAYSSVRTSCGAVEVDR